MQTLRITTLILFVILAILVIPRLQHSFTWVIKQTGETRQLTDYNFFQTEVYFSQGREPDKTICVHYNFRNVTAPLVVESLTIGGKYLTLKDVCAFEAMDYSARNCVSDFNLLSAQEKKIPVNVKEYYSFQHEFSIRNTVLDELDMEIQGIVRHGESHTRILQRLTAERDNFVELVPLDHHSDFLYLLIWPVAVIFVLCLTILVFRVFKNRKRL